MLVMCIAIQNVAYDLFRYFIHKGKSCGYRWEKLLHDLSDMEAEAVTQGSDRSCSLSGMNTSSSTGEFPKRRFRQKFHLGKKRGKKKDNKLSNLRKCKLPKH